MGLLYTKLKIFNYPDKIASLSADRPTRAPVHIRIKPTNACNHDCWFCAYRSGGHLQLGQDMVLRDCIPQAKMREIVSDIAAMGVKAVTFSGGGEPLIYPHLLETVRALAASSVEFATLTNGARLEGELAEFFAAKGRWVRVSIDGWDDASYSEFRGVRLGEFTRVIGNISRFKRLGGTCRLGVSIIVSQRNAAHIGELIAMLCQAGVDSMKLSPCVVSNDGQENMRYHQAVFPQVRAQIDRALAQRAGTNVEISDAYREFDGKFEKSYTWCPFLQILPVIGADMNVYACPDKAYNLETGLLGSIKDVSFREFWFSDKNKFFKIDPSKVCNHHCLANEKNKMILEYLASDPLHMGFV